MVCEMIKKRFRVEIQYVDTYFVMADSLEEAENIVVETNPKPDNVETQDVWVSEEEEEDNGCS